MRALHCATLAVALFSLQACGASLPQRAVQVYGSYAVAYEMAADLAADPEVPDELVFRIETLLKYSDPVIEGMRGALVTYQKAKIAGASGDELDALLAALEQSVIEAERVIEMIRDEGIAP